MVEWVFARGLCAAVGFGLAVAGSGTAMAQDAANPAAAMTASEAMKYVPDSASVAMPDLAFAETPQDAADFDKYYYFNRAGTSFAEALADLRDCDELARGLASGYKWQDTPYPYTGTMAGAVGGAIGNAFAEAIVGSANRRALRRTNMRRCMHYKGYSRYGVTKELWVRFNFEEGFSSVEEIRRQGMLAMQAKVASGPAPASRELGI